MIESHICSVPTLSVLTHRHAALLELFAEVEHRQDVEFDFASCRFVSPEAVAFLGALMRWLQHRGTIIRIRWDSLSPAVSAFLAQNGFMAAFGGPRAPWRGNAVPYLDHMKMDAPAFAAYVQSAWLGRGWVGMSSMLTAQMVGSVSEAYLNAFEHSDTPVGVHCCGQHFPTLKELSLSMVDFGVGIPRKVRTFKQSEALTAASCLEWAFQRGASTRPGNVSGGLGLDILTQFVAVNRGALDVYSDYGHACLRDGLTTFEDRADKFPGTLVTVRLKCDDRYYVLGSELPHHNPFQ